jgi:plastocyanin
VDKLASPPPARPEGAGQKSDAPREGTLPREADTPKPAAEQKGDVPKPADKATEPQAPESKSPEQKSPEQKAPEQKSPELKAPERAAPASPANGKAAAGDAAAGAPPSVTGKVLFKGKKPVMAEISAAKALAQCAALHKDPLRDESLVVNDDGTMMNVVVSVSAGVPARAYPVPPEAAVLDQKGCQYFPHVLAMMVGQKLVAKNSDTFLHNVHTMPQASETSNLAQPSKDETGAELKPVKSPEVFHVKCDVHPWMSAWIAAFDHPYFSVTDDSGTFALTDLPPGKYTLTAWHETLGTQKKEITIKAGEPADVEFTFEKK